jgi:hypothetical protein
MKKSRTGISIGLMTMIILLIITASVCAESTEINREYRLKAAFLYNFIKFVDWPAEKTEDSNEPITIGIIGKDPFGNTFEPLKGKLIKNREVLIKRFKSLEELKKAGENDKSGLDAQIRAIWKCHLLFICSSELKSLDEIIKLVKGQSVLTVGEMSDFLKAGGIINFLRESNIICFEMNVSGAKSDNLKISSKLLKLAKKVI